MSLSPSPHCLVFLNETLPQLLLGGGYRGPFMLQVLVPGQPSCEVHVDVRDGKASTRPGLAPVADVTLTVELPELEGLIAGTLNMSEAVRRGRVQAFGDDYGLERLAGCLAPPTSSSQSP